jgi:hypothetical protein
VRQQLLAQVEADLAGAGASSSERELARGLVSWDPSGTQADAPPAALIGAADAPRSRLLLAGRLFHNDRRHGRGALAHPRLMDVPWLCDGRPGEDIARIAERCGFWCAALPEAPAVAATAQHDLHELGGDDTPVEVDQSPLDPEEYAALVGDADADLAAWFPTPGDVGYELVRACGAEYFGLPREGGRVVLLNERNYLDLVYLAFAADVLASLERDLQRGEALVLLSSGLLDAWSEHYAREGLPQDLTPAALAYDDRLELPRWRAGPDGARLVVEHGRLGDRLVLLRSDAITLSVRPSLTLARRDAQYTLAWAHADTGYHYPGLEVMRLPRLNRLADEQVSEDRIPVLTRDLEELERALATFDDSAPASRLRANACGGSADAVVSILADGSTYFETLRPALKTILDCGYAHVELVTVEPTSGRPVPLRVSFALEPRSDAHHLQLENGRFSLRPWSDVGETEAFTGAARDETPLLTLYRHAVSGLDAGTLDPGRLLQISIADERVDAGVLATTLQVLLYRRDGEPASDAELLAAPLVVDGRGRPQALFPAGLVVNLR